MWDGFEKSKKKSIYPRDVGVLKFLILPPELLNFVRYVKGDYLHIMISGLKIEMIPLKLKKNQIDSR